MNELELEDIKAELCDDYCKRQEEALSKIKDVDEAMDWLMRTYCEDCPLGRIEAKWRNK